MPRIRTGLLKWTYLENLQTKPGFQITISIVQEHSQKQHTMKSLKKLKRTKRPNYSNLPVKEQKALQELQSRDNIVISETDKGGSVVMLDVEDYIKKAEGQLQNTKL